MNTSPPISRYAHTPLISVDRMVTLVEASRQMYLHDIGAVGVVDGDSLVGVLSERDVVRALAQGHEAATCTVRSWMSSPPITVRETDELLDVAVLMLDEGVRHLPLVDNAGAQHGMISLRDVERPLLELALSGPEHTD